MLKKAKNHKSSGNIILCILNQKLVYLFNNLFSFIKFRMCTRHNFNNFWIFECLINGAVVVLNWSFNVSNATICIRKRLGKLGSLLLVGKYVTKVQIFNSVFISKLID